MKLEIYSDDLEVKPEGSIQNAGTKVCMHVLGMARMDVRVMREARALTEVGMEVTVVDIERDATRPGQEDIDGVHVRHIVMPEWFVPSHFKPMFLVKLVRVIWFGMLVLLGIGADIYHAHGEWALPACYLAARLRKKRLVFDVRELPQVEPSVTRWHLLRAIARRLLRSMMAWCAGVIAVSSPIGRELRRAYGVRKAEVVRTIPGYQAPERSERLPQYLELRVGTRIALYEGNLDRRGFKRLISVARFLEPGIVIVVIGQARGVVQADVERLIACEGVSERVKIIPPVPSEELLSWTASADLGLVIDVPGATRREASNIQMCLPDKLFEYLMAGLPVLASPLGAVSDLIWTYDVGYIVDSDEPEEIGWAISAVLADHDTLTEMRQRALDVAGRDLCWEKESRRLISLYEDILGFEQGQGSERRFDARRYRERRLQANPGIMGVGYPERSIQFVSLQYRSRMRRVEMALREYGLGDLSGRPVLDVGSGTGIWLKFLHRHGAERVVRLDLAKSDVERLRARFPEDLIVQADVTARSLPIPETMRFDVISAFDVLLNIGEMDALRQTIGNLAKHCAPGGWLIISDTIVQGWGYVPAPRRMACSEVRSVAEYREVLEEHGFVIDSIRPATVLLSEPLEAPSQLEFLGLLMWWKISGLWGRSNVLSRLVGQGVVEADQLACRFCSVSSGPGVKLLFARKLD